MSCSLGASNQKAVNRKLHSRIAAGLEVKEGTKIEIP